MFIKSNIIICVSSLRMLHGNIDHSLEKEILIFPQKGGVIQLFNVKNISFYLADIVINKLSSRNLFINLTVNYMNGKELFQLEAHSLNLEILMQRLL